MAMAEPRTAALRGAGFWVPFFALLFAAWAALFVMAADFANRAPVVLLGPGMELLAPLFPASSAGLDLPGFLQALCFSGPGPGDSPWPALFGMWSLMALAMMAPTAVPLLRTYGDLHFGNPQRVPVCGFYGLAAGFCAVWILFAAMGAFGQLGLSKLELLTFGGVLEANWLSALLLVGAGLYQFTALKAACLSRCRSPITFFMTHWRAGLRGAFRMGLLQGLFCLGCCWALMALAFVGGTMNIVWMGVAMIIMTVEKLPALGRRLSAPLGVGLIIAGATVALFGPIA